MIKTWKDLILNWRLRRYQKKWVRMKDSLFIDEIYIKGRLFYTIYEYKYLLWGLIKIPTRPIKYHTTSVRDALRKRDRLLIAKVKDYERRSGERFVFLKKNTNI